MKRVTHKQSKKNNKTKGKKFSWQTVAGVIVVAVCCVAGAVVAISNRESVDYVVETNAFFAPFEYYEGRKIVGVDIEIINRVAEKLNAKIAVKDVEFDVIIDNVEAGKIADAGAAGLTITPARAEKVNFSIPYYSSVQYLIFSVNNVPELSNANIIYDAANKPKYDGYVVWDALAGKTLGTQTGSTGYLFASDEIDQGALAGTGTELKGFESHQLAADAINSHIIDYAIADELAAKFIVDKNNSLAAVPLYYSGEPDYPVEESYAIAVNKEKTELLEAFNEVLAEMLTEDANGETEIDRLVLKYMGLSE